MVSRRRSRGNVEVPDWDWLEGQRRGVGGKSAEMGGGKQPERRPRGVSRMPQQRVGLESPALRGLGGHRCLAKELGLHRKVGQSTEEYEIVKQPVKEL